jgi:S1-C subfamily serine protease
MPAAPPYTPVAEPPWADQFPPAPPQWTPPPPPPSEPPPPRRRGRATAIVVALSLLCGGIGLELGGALFGSPHAQNTRASHGQPLPTVGSTPTTAPGGSASTAAADIAAKVDPAVVDITTTLSGGHAAGTGMVLTSDGLVLTNNHVIADATDIKVQVNGSGPTYSAKVLGYDITDDVALLQMDGASNLATVSVGDSSTVAVRDRIVALGNALGKGGTPAIAEGAVVALDQTIQAGDFGGPSQTLTNLIEISAPLVPGDSGGPVANTAGQVIAMNVAASPSNQNPRRRAVSDAYAIPINKALDIAHQIQNGQSSSNVHIGDRGLLGVQVQARGQNGDGAIVASVQSGSPAEGAGLTAGDEIVSVGSKQVSSLAELSAALGPFHPGDKVSIGWLDANGGRHTATVQLITGPPA